MRSPAECDLPFGSTLLLGQMLEQRPVQPTLCCFGSEAPAPQQCVHGWLCPDSSRSISVVTAPVPTDTWSRHSPQAGLVPGAGPSQLVHDHQEGLCHDGTVSVLGRWMQGAVLTVSRAEARPRGTPSEDRLWLLLSSRTHSSQGDPLFPHHHPHLPPPHLPPGLINSTAH